MRWYSLVFILVFLFLLSVPEQMHGQNQQNRDFPAIGLAFTPAKILPTNPFVEGENLAGKPLRNMHSGSLKMLWQNPGYREWQRVYHIPYYGIGFSWMLFHSKELGNPYSVWGVLGVPIIRMKKLELYSEFQFGTAWGWHKYDSVTNPLNIAVGGGMTVHLDIGLKAFWPVTPSLDLAAGVGFMHFSNGGFERPNRGLNLVSPVIELRYHLHGRPETREAPEAGRLPRSNELYLMLGYGDHQIVEHELDTNYFAVGGLSAVYLIQHTNAFKSGPGIDLNFWWGMTAHADGTPGPVGWKNLSTGLLWQMEFALSKLSLTGGIGNYVLHHNYGNFNQFYQRLGVRYHITNHISAGIHVRAINFMLAEFLEFHLGYRFIRPKS